MVRLSSMVGRAQKGRGVGRGVGVGCQVVRLDWSACTVDAHEVKMRHTMASR